MKKKLLILALALGLWFPAFAAPVSVSAVNVFPQCNGSNTTDLCKSVDSTTSTNPAITALRTVINIISFIIGISAIIVIIISGLRMIVSGGDPNNVKSAREAIIYALVGVVVALVAQAIVVFVLNKL